MFWIIASLVLRLLALILIQYLEDQVLQSLFTTSIFPLTHSSRIQKDVDGFLFDRISGLVRLRPKRRSADPGEFQEARGDLLTCDLLQ